MIRPFSGECLGSLARRARSFAGWAQGACHAGLCLAGWLLVTLCCTGAAWLALFVCLGQFSFGGTVLHLDNFASRYLAADLVRQAHITDVFWRASVLIFLVIAVLRRGSLQTIFPPRGPSLQKEPSHG